MTEKALLNKSNIVIYKNEEILGGIFSFSIGESSNTKYAYEILSAEPWTAVEQQSSYTVTICQYAENFKDYGKDFSLSFKTDTDEVRYKLCNVKSKEISSDNKGRLITTLVITASDREVI